MSATWAVVAAALGSSALSGLIAYGTGELRARKQAEGERLRARGEAYNSAIAASGLLAHRAHSLHVLMKTKSGVSEGLAAVLGTSEPIDALGVDVLLRRDIEPLYAAWAAVWVTGSEEGISAVNEVMQLGAAVVEAATVRGAARSKGAGALRGEKWTEEQLTQWEEQVKALGAARRRLATVARREMGSESVAFLG